MPDHPHFRLFVDEIDTVGFVDKGDDPEASVVFYKRRDGDDPPHKTGAMDTIKNFLRALGLKSGMNEDEVEKLLADGADGGSDDDGGSNHNGDGHMTFDVNNLDDEARAAFDAAVEKAVADRLKDDSDDDKLPTDVPEAVTKQFEAMKDSIAKANDRADQAEARIQKLLDQQERDAYIAKAKSLDIPGASPDDFADILRKAEGALDEDERQKFTDVLKTVSEAARSSDMFKELGSDDDQPNDAEAEVAALVKQYREEDPTLTEQLARGMVWQNRPDLLKKTRSHKEN